MTKRKEQTAETEPAGDPNDRVIEARNGDNEVVATFTPGEKETPVKPAVDGPSPVDVERRATAAMVADLFNGLHKRVAHIERLQGIENEHRDRETIVTATTRGDLAD